MQSCELLSLCTSTAAPQAIMPRKVSLRWGRLGIRSWLHCKHCIDVMLFVPVLPAAHLCPTSVHSTNAQDATHSRHYSNFMASNVETATTNSIPRIPPLRWPPAFHPSLLLRSLRHMTEKRSFMHGRTVGEGCTTWVCDRVPHGLTFIPLCRPLHPVAASHQNL